MTNEQDQIKELLSTLKERRWTQVMIAAELGVGVQTVWRWNKGYNAGHVRVVRIALEWLVDRP